MENGENTSAKSQAGTPTSLKTPNSLSPPGLNKKQVGFARTKPTLVIPPPAGFPSGKSPHSAQTIQSAPATGSNHVYNRKASVFMFDQFQGVKDFTKSGLGIGEKCAYCVYNKLKSWSKKWFTHMFLTIVLTLYTIGGALVFEFIEGRHETAVKAIDLRDNRDYFVGNVSKEWKRTQNGILINEWEAYVRKRLKDYEKTVIQYYQNDKLLAVNPEGKVWTFWNAIVYCGTICTTIGYGHIYPTTVTGKALTIAYAIIGIPLFLLALTDFGKLFTRCIKFFWSFVRRVYYTGNCRRARKTAHVKEIFKGAQMMYEIATFRRPSTFVDPEAPPSPESSTGQIGDDTPTTPAISNFEIDDEFNLPISLAIFILVLYIFFGALIYCVWEQWDFFNSFYFVFISMSTVGFGDIVPDDPVCMIVSIVYLVFGLALMSMCINVVQLKLSDTFSRASNKIGATIGISVAEEDGSINTVAPEAVELPGIHETPENGGEASPSSLTEIDLTKRD